MPGTIGVHELAQHIDANDIFVLDIRGTAHASQVFGAVRYDPAQLERADELALPLPRGSGLIVLYDDSGNSKHLEELARKFESAGYGPIRTLEGGFAAWTAGGGRCEEPTLEQPVPGVSG